MGLFSDLGSLELYNNSPSLVLIDGIKRTISPATTQKRQKKQGRHAFGCTQMTGDARKWMTTWLRQHATDAAAGGGDAHARPPGDG